MKRFVSYFLQFLPLLLFSSVCLAQNSLPDAHLSGTITDLRGGGVGGVHISAFAQNQPQGNIWRATSTTDGQFSLSLPPGKYRIVLTRSSFAPRDYDLELAAGETKTLSVRMELEQLSASVVVTAEAEPLQAQQTTAPVETITRDEIDQRQFKTLPDAFLTLT